MAGAAQAEKVQEILAIFEKQNRDGTYKYSDQEVREFLPLLVLTFGGGSKGPLTPNLERLMNEAAAAMDVGPDAKPAEVQQAVERYYKAHPPNSQLKSAFLAFVRRELGEDFAGKAASSAQKIAAFKKYQDAEPRRERIAQKDNLWGGGEKSTTKAKALKEPTKSKAKAYKETTKGKAKAYKETTKSKAKAYKGKPSKR